MTWILQADNATWAAGVGHAEPNQSALGIVSPVITVPYTTDILFMDCVTYSGETATGSNQGEQVQIWFKQPIEDGGLKASGPTNYMSVNDFYYDIGHPGGAFKTATAYNVRKNGGGWVAGDTFVMLWLFYEVNTSSIAGIKSIRFY